MKRRKEEVLVTPSGEDLLTCGSFPKRRNSYNIWLAFLALLILLCFDRLAHNNMSGNEIEKLTVARKYVDPSWISGDWFLNQHIGYQALFAIVFGGLVKAWGFLATSIVGRFLCLCLISSALAALGRRLAISLPLLLLVVAFLLKKHSVCAVEYMIGPMEGKVIAYGLVLWAIERMFNKSYRIMALLLGLATSFHVLAGGYATLTVLGWILLRWKTRLPTVREAAQGLLLYLGGSLFAIDPILRQINSPPIPTGAVWPSYIYVFIRNPHHIDPSRFHLWPWLYVFFFLLLVSFGFFYKRRHLEETSQPYDSRSGLFEFTLISMVPFVMGLAIAPFDRQGQFLQYYAFRFGDVMLPLGAYLLTACALGDLLSDRSYVTERTRKWLLVPGVLLLSAVYFTEANNFVTDLSALRQFPGPQQKVSPDEKEMFEWVKSNTPRECTIVSSPDTEEFSWITERATIAKFKLVPTNSAGILEWYQRLNDLSGNDTRWKDRGFRGERAERLAIDYRRLTTVQVQKLMAKYKAEYFLTTVDQKLELPVFHRNAAYVLYSREGLTPGQLRMRVKVF